MASEPPAGHDLRHHGDVDAEPGLLDFAVNVQGDGPPGLAARPARRRPRRSRPLPALPRYDARARAAVAARHGRRPDEVLVLAGGAEGFALLPALRPAAGRRRAPGVHRAGGGPARGRGRGGARAHRRRRRSPAATRPRCPPDADLVVVGNPTNPTGVLHPAADLRGLARPGRVLVVDEAFADAVPGEPESLAGDTALPGLLVLRSLTKTWALAGLRAGYALGDPALLARLAAPRPHVAGVDARAGGGHRLLRARPPCPPATERAAERPACRVPSRPRRWPRSPGVAGAAGRAPYLLLRLPDGRGERIRARAARPRASRSAARDTFPGLGPDHLRVAVRPPAGGAAAGRGARPTRCARWSPHERDRSRDVVAALEAAYPPALAADWDAVGLVCGDPDEPVSRGAVRRRPGRRRPSTRRSTAAPSCWSPTIRCCCAACTASARTRPRARCCTG